MEARLEEHPMECSAWIRDGQEPEFAFQVTAFTPAAWLGRDSCPCSPC